MDFTNEKAFLLGKAFSLGMHYPQLAQDVKDIHGNEHSAENGRFVSKGEGGQSKAESKLTDADFKDLRKKKNALIGKPSGTYDIKTGKPVSFKTGYQVSFQTTSGEDKNSPNYLNDAQYDKMAKELCREANSRPYAGVFDETPEVSARVRTKKQAEALLVKYKQYSAWDWKKGVQLPNKHHAEIEKENVIIKGK